MSLVPTVETFVEFDIVNAVMELATLPGTHLSPSAKRTRMSNRRFSA